MLSSGVTALLLVTELLFMALDSSYLINPVESLTGSRCR
jgi:hypothetical protein